MKYRYRARAEQAALVFVGAAFLAVLFAGPALSAHLNGGTVQDKIGYPVVTGLALVITAVSAGLWSRWSHLSRGR